MSVSVIIGRTNKAINSTSQTFADSVSLSCRLKEPCSQQSPVFIVQGLSKTVYYNFAQFMNHYYWVDDIVYLTNDVQEVHCHLDPLATYKGAIENSYAFVQFGSSDNWNKDIDDYRMQPAARIPVFGSDVLFDCIPGLTDISSGYVIMRYMDCSTSGGVKTVAMGFSTFFDCLADLQSNINPNATVGEIVSKIGGLGSWCNSIISAVYIPTSSINTTAPTSTIHIGGITCSLNGPAYYQSSIVTANHPENVTLPFNLNTHFAYCPFMKNRRWTSIQISTPFGHADIPLDFIKPTSAANPTILVKSSLDILTGNVVIRVTDESGQDGTGMVLATFSGCIGVDMMSMIGNEGFRGGMLNSLQSGAELAVSAFSLGTSMGMSGSSAFSRSLPSASARKDMSTGAKLEALNQASVAEQQATIASGIDGIASCLPTGVGGLSTPSGGGAGTFASLYLTNPKGKGTISIRYFRPTFYGSAYTSFCDMYGYPVMDYCKLSTTPGWIKCSGASVQDALGATEANKSTINSYLNSGIILED